jgi:hypothetical protein
MKMRTRWLSPVCNIYFSILHIITCHGVDEGYRENYKGNMADLVSLSPLVAVTLLVVSMLLTINGQVFEEASTFREELKMLARQVVESEYSIFFPIDVGHNSDDASQYTAQNVEVYLEKGRFLRDDGFDAEVLVNVFFPLHFTTEMMTRTGAYKKHSAQSHRHLSPDVLPPEKEDGTTISE